MTKVRSPRKKTPIPIRTAITTGISWRLRARLVRTTTAETAVRIHAHRSSDPAWLPHSAVILYSALRVLEVYSATLRRLKSSVSSATHIVPIARLVKAKVAYTPRSALCSQARRPGRREASATTTT